jgi:hypothetical protein
MRKEAVVAFVKLLMDQLVGGDILYVSQDQFDLNESDMKEVMRALQYMGFLVTELYEPVTTFYVLGVTRVSLRDIAAIEAITAASLARRKE